MTGLAEVLQPIVRSPSSASLGINLGCNRIPDSIVSDRDPKFMLIFWRELLWIMDIKPLMSTAFHPQTDGSTERANCSIGQILWTVVRDDQKDWAHKCPVVEFAMVEFAMNSNMSSTTGFAPFKLSQGYMSQTGIPTMVDTHFKGVKQFAEQARSNLLAAHDAILENCILQSFHTNKKRQVNPDYKQDDFVYLSTKNLALPKGRAWKLVPKFIGPYKILEAHNQASMVTLKLPPELTSRRITPTFHTSLVRPFVPNDEVQFPKWEAKSFYDFGNDDDQEWLVEEIIAHRWEGNKNLSLQVRWTLRDVTWEPYNICKDLEALDRYLELQGVSRVCNLGRIFRVIRYMYM